jgi:hypothetical protein
LTVVSKPESKPRNLTMPIISFSKKALDEYMDLSSHNSDEVSDSQVTHLELTNSSKEALSIPLDVESFTEV